MIKKDNVKNSPCTKTCPNRTPTCHGDCEDYKNWTIERKKGLEIRVKRDEYEKYIEKKKYCLDLKRYAIRRAYAVLSVK